MQFGSAATWGTDPNTASEGAETSEVVLFASGEFERRFAGLVGSGFESILDMETVMEGIGPEMGIKTGAKKHGMEGISNGEVGTFNGGILARVVRASGADGVMMFLEQFADLGFVVEFTTLVHDNTFVGAGGGVLFEEFTKMRNGCSLVDTCVPMVASKEMVGDEDPSGFAIKAHIVFLAVVCQRRTGQ